MDAIALLQHDHRDRAAVPQFKSYRSRAQIEAEMS